MFEELLPEDGVNVPGEILYDKSLSVGLKTTWMQLRGLAWEDGETPMMTISALCEITGKCRATIYGHLGKLSDLGLLKWQPHGGGRLSVNFSRGTQRQMPINQSFDGSKILDNLSKDLDSNSLKLKNIVQSEDLIVKARAKVKEGGVQQFRQPVHEFGQLQVQDQQSELETEKTPAQVYREVMHLTANRVQREEIDRVVRDLDLWRDTLKYWMLHNWNPFNLPGLLDMYQQGGPQRSRSYGRRDAGEETSFEQDREQRERNRSEALRTIAAARAKRQAREAAESSLGDQVIG